MLARFYWYLDPLSPKRNIYCQCCRVGPPLTKLSRSAHEKNQYIDNSMQNRQAHFPSVSECVDQMCRKMCILIRPKCSLKRLFTHQRHRIMRVRIYVPIKCQACFGPKCPGLVNKLFCWFYFRRNPSSGSFYTPVSRDSGQ